MEKKKTDFFVFREFNSDDANSVFKVCVKSYYCTIVDGNPTIINKIKAGRNLSDDASPLPWEQRNRSGLQVLYAFYNSQRLGANYNDRKSAYISDQNLAGTRQFF